MIAAIDSRAYWYLTRATGAVSLVLLTAVIVLGVLGALRFAAAPRWPRFAVDSLHRDLSLLAMAVLAVHIITSVLDSFAPIRLTDAVIPFVGLYRPLWLGLGALAFDLMIALVITSLIRRRLGYRSWRAIHWLAYASWPVAVLHGLGAGSDTKEAWMLALTVACVAAVAVACLARISRGETPEGLRAPAATLAVITPVALGVFTLAGPLQTGWARQAGTPTRLLANSASRVGGATVVARGRRAAARSQTVPAAGVARLRPFSARLDGTLKQSFAAGGTIVDLALRFRGGRSGRLRVRMAGAPIGGGGLSLTGSQVDLVADGYPYALGGAIQSLQGLQFIARVAGPAGSRMELNASLQIDNQTGAVTGTLVASG
jgi:methionine sulfoxide reductase heme-binding subunit